MKTLKDVIDEQQRNRAAHDDPLTDRLMAEVVFLAEEVCVLRDRLDTGERLATLGKRSDQAAIDAFEPNADIVEQRLERHSEFFEELFSRLAVPASNVER